MSKRKNDILIRNIGKASEKEANLIDISVAVSLFTEQRTTAKQKNILLFSTRNIKI